MRVGNRFSNLDDQLECVPQGSVLNVTLFDDAMFDIIKTVPSVVSCSLWMIPRSTAQE